MALRAKLTELDDLALTQPPYGDKGQRVYGARRPPSLPDLTR